MTERNGNILIVDDDDDILVAGRLLLRRHFNHVRTITEPEEIPALLARENFDVILLDMNFGPGESNGRQGFHWLERILQIDPQVVVITITAHGGVDVAVEAMKRGATDFITKPWQNERLLATLTAAMRLRSSRLEAAELKATNRVLADASVHGGQSLLGHSAAMEDVRSMIRRAGPTDANVLILGENGTGKELVARDLHLQSGRAMQVFLSVDVGALSEGVFESELFGHRKGAFTDAREDRAGRFQAANAGTLFLDEIGNVPMHLQSKLLTVLEQRQVTPLGSNQAVPVDVRVIAATNLSTEQLRDENRFRQDLLFRLNTVEICLPPLRDRADDIEEIARHYAAVYARRYSKPDRPFSRSAMQAMLADPWPGNVRALRHAIERAVILAEGGEFSEGDLQLAPPGNATTVDSGVGPASPQTIQQGEQDLNLERMERNTIAQALQKHRYNISHAARELGLTRAALYRRMEKHEL